MLRLLSRTAIGRQPHVSVSSDSPQNGSTKISTSTDSSTLGGFMKAISSSIILVSVLVLAPIGAAQAACGIGSSIWEGNNGPGAKLLASTTNFWTVPKRGEASTSSSQKSDQRKRKK